MPSNSKIHRMIRDANITMQCVRDHKKKTVHERIDQVRKQLIRIDRGQRSRGKGKRDQIYGRFSPEMTFIFDEQYIIMFPKTKKTYNPKGAPDCHVKIPAGLDTRQASGCPIFKMKGPQLKQIIAILPLAPMVTKKDPVTNTQQE